MRISSRSRYAVAAMAEVARCAVGAPISLREVAARQNTSLSYLEPMFSMFRTSGLVQSTRGPGGGYSLARSPREISVAEVIRSINEDIYSTPAEANNNIPPYVMTADLWTSMNKTAFDFLETVTLASLTIDNQVILKPREIQAFPQKVLKECNARPILKSSVPNSVFAMGQLALNSEG